MAESLINWHRKPYTPKSNLGKYVPGNMETISFERLIGEVIEICEVGRHQTRWGHGHGYRTMRNYVVFKWKDVLYFSWLDY